MVGFLRNHEGGNTGIMDRRAQNTVLKNIIFHLLFVGSKGK